MLLTLAKRAREHWQIINELNHFISRWRVFSSLRQVSILSTKNANYLESIIGTVDIGYVVVVVVFSPLFFILLISHFSSAPLTTLTLFAYHPRTPACALESLLSQLSSFAAKKFNRVQLLSFLTSAQLSHFMCSIISSNQRVSNTSSKQSLLLNIITLST